MGTVFKFKSKSEFEKHLKKFFRLAGDPTYVPRPTAYNNSFINGDSKSLEVINYLTSKKAPMSKLAYISIGGADGADVIKVLQNTDVNHGILVEYDSAFCDLAKNEANYLMPGKKLYVVEGDAFSNCAKVNSLLTELVGSGQIDGVVLTGFSVFHELPDRSSSMGYSLRTLITQMVEGIKHVYFYSKEPCDFVEWTGRVELSFPDWLTTSNLTKFSRIVQAKLAFGNTDAFNERIVELKDSVEMSSKLATEVVKKILYFLMDGLIDKLLYELQESHSKFLPEDFSKTINGIFSTNTRSIDSNISTRFETSATFKRLYLEAGVNIKSVNNSFIDSVVPAGFVTVNAFFRPVKASKTDLSSGYGKAISEKDAVVNFFSAVVEKDYTSAFGYLNSNLRKNRWQGSIDRFIDGYQNKVQCKLVSVSEVDTQMGKAWLVYWQEEVDAFMLDGMSRIEDIVRTGIESFDLNIIKNRIDKCRVIVKELGGDQERFGRIPFFRFLHPNFLDDVRWISGVETKKMKNLFRTEKVLVHATYLTFCQEQHGEWLIAKISPINFNGLPLK